MNKFVLMVRGSFVVVVLSLFLNVDAIAQDVQESERAVQDKSIPVNVVTTAAVSRGVLSCASRINQVSNYLTQNTKNGAYLFPVNESQTDPSLFSSSFEILLPERSAVYASANFMRNDLGGCQAVYDTVEYVDKSCLELKDELTVKSEVLGEIKRDIQMFDAGPVKFFTIPAGEGCILIQKEIVQ